MHLWRVLPKYGKNLVGIFRIEPVPVGKKYPVRAKLIGLKPRHRRTNAELSRFIRRRRNHAPTLAAADDDRLVFQARIERLLHGRIECIHVDVEKPTHESSIGINSAQRKSKISRAGCL